MERSEAGNTSLAPIECCVCTEPLTDPRALPCGHSYCGPHKPCLQTLMTLPTENSKLRCAMCNKEFEKETLVLNPLYGIRDFLRETCGSESKDTKQKFIFPSCEFHPNEPVLFWCLTDNSKACQTCFETSHNRHSLLSYKKHLQEQVKERLANDSDKLTSWHKEAQELIEKCDERVDELKKGIAHYNQIANALKNGRDLIEVRFCRHLESLRNFEKDVDYDLNLQTIDSFLDLDDKLSELKSLIDTKDTKILGYQSMEFMSRFRLISNFLNYEIKGCYMFSFGSNTFNLNCHLPAKTSKKSPLMFSVTGSLKLGVEVEQRVEFYGKAEIRSATTDHKTGAVTFGAKSEMVSSVCAEAILTNLCTLWDKDQKFLNDDWTFDVFWTLVFYEPKNRQS